MSDQIVPIINQSSEDAEWQAFARVGCAYFPIPEELKTYVPSTLQLASSLNSSYEGHAGYSREKNQQIELLYFERKDWHYYPEKTARLADGMSRIAQFIVLKIAQSLEIDLQRLSIATGGLNEGKGKSYFKVMHYDSSKNFAGLPWHKDVRFVTVLYTNQKGLEGLVSGQELSIEPKDGYFLINLGVFFEALVNDSKKLNALVHQVRQVQEDRVSFGVFCEGCYPEKGFWQLKDNEIIWMEAQAMDSYLIKNKDASFSINPHRIFGQDN